MFMDVRVQEGSNKRDDDGAKRSFFGGERFLEGISGQAYVIFISHLNLHASVNDFIKKSVIKFCLFSHQITVQRTQLNDPMGLEARLHITEAVCPALSEPG